ncbi:hypothetical protein HQ520_18280, partial [bacterium]|nr:hypothetical protein [bacterium]
MAAPHSASWWENRGSASLWLEHSFEADIAHAISISVVDLDQNEDSDILVGSYCRVSYMQVSISELDGSSRNPPHR